MVRFGLLHLFEDAAGHSESQFYGENIELAEYADDVGLDTIWLAEHHFTEYGVMPSTQVFGSFLAARTKRIRIGSGVVVLPFHNPMRVAEEFAFLDQLSGGRLDFGIGRGYQPGEFAGYGIPMEHSREIFDESFEIIRQAWTQPEVNFKGKHFQFEGVTPRPKPVQKPHPPFFGASFNPATVKYQALKKMNLLFSPLTTTPQPVKDYRDLLREGGEDPDNYRIGGLSFVYLHEDPDQALKDFEKPCMWYMKTLCKYVPPSQYKEGDEYYKLMHGSIHAAVEAYEKGQLTFKQMVGAGPFQHAFLVGSPETVSAKLSKLFGMYEGLTDLLCWTRLGGLDHKKVMNSMDLFVNKCVKPFKSALAEGKPL